MALETTSFRQGLSFIRCDEIRVLDIMNHSLSGELENKSKTMTAVYLMRDTWYEKGRLLTCVI